MSVKAIVAEFVYRLVPRTRLIDSLLYRAYLRVAHPEHVRSVAIMRTLIIDALGSDRGDLAFDIGANSGDKTAMLLPIFRRVVSVEPSPANAKTLRERFARKRQVRVVEAGCAEQEGDADFFCFSAGDCYNTFSPKWVQSLAGGTATLPTKVVEKVIRTPMTTLDRLIEDHGSPTYVKIDAEGYESSILRGLSRRIVVPLVTIECKLPEFKDETLDCISRMTEFMGSRSFNFCIDEPPRRFEAPRWLSAEEIVEVVRHGPYRWMEIYGRSRGEGTR